MSGIKCVLDTNFVLGLLRSEERTLAWIRREGVDASECAYSAITRMELLGFGGITASEDRLIRERLAMFSYVALSGEVEDEAIRIRRANKIGLPDAIIAATALLLDARVLTHDEQFLSVFSREVSTRAR